MTWCLNTPGETSPLLQGFMQVWVSRNIYLLLAQIYCHWSKRKIPLPCSSTHFQISPDTLFHSVRSILICLGLQACMTNNAELICRLTQWSKLYMCKKIIAFLINQSIILARLSMHIIINQVFMQINVWEKKSLIFRLSQMYAHTFLQHINAFSKWLE